MKYTQTLNEEVSRIKKLMNISESQNLKPPLDVKIHVNSGFGYRNIGSRASRNHKGVDLRANKDNIKSPLDGKVTVSDINYNSMCGGTIDIEHADGFKSRFCHVMKLMVKKGDIVKQGQIVGISGGDKNDPGKGNSMGRHLHWTLMKNGKAVDPMQYIDKTVNDKVSGSTSQNTGLFGNLFSDGSLNNASDFISKIIKYIFPFMNEQFSSGIGNGVYTKKNSIVIPKKNNSVVYSPTKGKITFGNCLRLEFVFENKTYYCDYCNLTINPQLRSGDRIDIGEKLGTIEKTDVVITFYDNREKEISLSTFQKSNVSTDNDSTTPYPSFVKRPKPLSVNPRPNQTKLSVNPRPNQTQLSVNPRPNQTQLSVNPIQK